MRIAKIILIIFIIIFFITACNFSDYVLVKRDEIVSKEAYEKLKDELNEYENKEIVYRNRIRKLEEKSKEIDKYRDFLQNLNFNLDNIYQLRSYNSEYEIKGVAFSIEYNNKFYLISAGHCVEYQVENGTVIKANNFEYRKDNSDNWKKIKLLKYNSNTEGCNDYAIFYSDKIKRGFILDDDNDAPEFVISKLYDNRILINEICTDNIIEGQSGSPIFDYENEIVGILIAGLYLDYNINQFLEEDVIKSFYTRIQIVIHALTSLGS